MSLSETAPAKMPSGVNRRTVRQREARAFGKDLAKLIEKAQNAGDLRYTPICVDLLFARKKLSAMLHHDDREETK